MTMTDAGNPVRRHYEPQADDARLVEAVQRALEPLGAGELTVAQLAGLDQFHVRGLAATAELADLAAIGPDMTVLDAGSGLGGPSRYLAERFGCTVVGVDLAASFVEVAELLARRTGLDGRVSYRTGDLLALPFEDAAFDIVWTQHVAMNIADRARLYGEFARVLKRGGRVVFYDVIAANGAPVILLPVPWAETQATSFLLDKQATIAALAGAGFALEAWKDVTDASIAALPSSGPPALGPMSLSTIMGPRFPAMGANLARNLREGRVRLVMGSAAR